MDELIRQINDLGGRTPAANVEAIIRSTNASPERRVAAVLLHVAPSDLPISAAVCQLLMTLQTPGWEEAEDDPTTTPVGRMIISHLHDNPDDLYQVSVDPAVGVTERMACQLILRSIKAKYPSNESLDLVLKATTGHDAVWWIDWITEQRSGRA